MANLFYVFLGLLLIDCAIGCYAVLLKKMGKNILPLFLAVACSFLDEILGHYFKMKYKNNLAVYYFGEAFEYAFFVLFIYRNTKSRLVKKTVLISIWSIFAVKFGYGYWFLIKSYIDPFTALIIQDYFTVVQGLLLAIFSICYFKGIFDSISRFEYLNVYVLVAVSGILFYYAFSAIYFAAETYLVNLSLKENPNLFSDLLKRKVAAFTYAYNQLHEIKIFLFLTNMLLYLCALVVFLKSAFGKKIGSRFQFQNY